MHCSDLFLPILQWVMELPSYFNTYTKYSRQFRESLVYTLKIQSHLNIMLMNLKVSLNLERDRIIEGLLL